MNDTLNKPPEWLDARAAELYTVQADKLELQQVDFHSLAEWAQAASDVERLTLRVREEGEVLISLKTQAAYPNPTASALASVCKRAAALAKELGLTPGSRSRMKAEVIKQEPQYRHWKTGEPTDNPIDAIPDM